jgi:hypothetical protein
MSGFWRNWFSGFCLSLLIFGVILAGGAFEATTGPVRWLLTVLGGSADITFDPPLRFSLALIGSISIGWAVAFYYTIDAAIDLGPLARPLWRGMTVAVIVWFVIDSSLSVATGFALNVIPNLLLLGQYFIGVRGSGVMKVSA